MDMDKLKNVIWGIAKYKEMIAELERRHKAEHLVDRNREVCMEYISYIKCKEKLERKYKKHLKSIEKN